MIFSTVESIQCIITDAHTFDCLQEKMPKLQDETSLGGNLALPIIRSVNLGNLHTS